MRQVGHDELVHVLQAGLRRLKPSQIKALQDWRTTEQLRARVAIAEQMAGYFARYEILTTAPAPPPFRYADLGDPSGAPPVDD